MARFQFTEDDDENDDEGDSDNMSIDQEYYDNYNDNNNDPAFANGRGTLVSLNGLSLLLNQAATEEEQAVHHPSDSVAENSDQGNDSRNAPDLHQASVYENNQETLTNSEEQTTLAHPYQLNNNNRNSSCCYRMLILLLTVAAGVSLLAYNFFLPPAPPQLPQCSSFFSDNDDDDETLNIDSNNPLAAVCSAEPENRTYQALFHHHGSEILQGLQGFARIFSFVANHTLFQVADGTITHAGHFRDSLHSLTTPSKCIFAKQPPPRDFYRRLTNHTPEILTQPHGVKHMIDQLEHDYWGQHRPQSASHSASSSSSYLYNTTHRRPTVFWVEAGSEDLGVDTMASNMVELIMSECTSRPLPFAQIKVSQDDDVLSNLHYDDYDDEDDDDHHISLARWVNRIDDILRPWKSHGGILVMEDVHKLPPTDLAKLLKILMTDIPYDSPLASFQEQLRGVSDNVIVIFTSMIGVRLMADQFSLAGGVAEQVPRAVLVQMLESSIRQHLRYRITVPLDNIMPFWFQTMANLNTSIPLLLQQQVSALEWKDIRLQSSMLEELYSGDRTVFFNIHLPNYAKPVQLTEQGYATLRSQLTKIVSRLENDCSARADKSWAFAMSYDFAKRQVVLNSISTVVGGEDDGGEHDAEDNIDAENIVCSFDY